MAALVLAVQTRDVVRDRARERAFRLRPGARFADVLVTNDADNTPFEIDRGVEHGRDAERLQISIVQLGSERRAERVFGDDRAMLAHRGEVRGEILASQNGALEQLMVGLLRKVTAAKCAPVVNEYPASDSLHAQRLRGDFGELDPYLAKRLTRACVQARKLQSSFLELRRPDIA